ncbi:MAG: hypothetical protein ACI4S4_04045 [Candidatus Ornithospirochaeta sp.]
MCEKELREWNKLFISISLHIGEIYFHTLDMAKTLSCVRKEERWTWVDEEFVHSSSRIYRWLITHPGERNNVLLSSFEDILSHIDNAPSSPIPPSPSFPDGYLKNYLGADWDN